VVQYAQQKIIYNWEDLVYIDLTQPYWDSSLNKSLTINNSTYFAFGAYDLSYYDLTHVLVFNKDMIQDYGMDMPYDIVRSGKWTLDKFREMARQTTLDVNGDGIMDINDSYGMISVPKQVLPSFWIAAGELSIAKDENDYPSFNIPGNERFYSLADKIFEIMWDDNVWCRNTEITNFWSASVPTFSSNRALFASQTFHFLDEFRNVDTNFGIIPYPKFTEDQPQYYSRVEGGCKIAIVPITNQSPEKAGAILEAMACESYKTVIPQYYEVALKRKNSRDSESEEMLDLIFAARIYDLGDTWWCNDLRDGIFAGMFTNNNRDIVSRMESFASRMDNLIEKTIDSFID
jgi:ABC-type glycerol-3-phosphate transport system substrate-binding protein